MTSRHPLGMARGNDAYAVPAPYERDVVTISVQLDRALEIDLAEAERLAKDELEILGQAEQATGHRLHKGHALHNLGVAIVTRDPELARRYFRAALVEDVRTDPGGGSELARRMLVELYGELAASIEELGKRGVDTTEDPLEVAVRFDEEEGPFGIYRGLRQGTYPVSSLDGVGMDQLVFVGGAHAEPDRILALRDAVAEIGLRPVVVIEFEDFTDNAYTKSRALMERCGRAVFDLTRSDAGQVLEIPMARGIPVPLFAGWVGNSTQADLFASAMTKGLLREMGVIPVAAVANEQLKEAARTWLRRTHPRVGPSIGTNYVYAPAAVHGLPTAIPSSGFGPLARGSNSAFTDFDAPVATTSGSPFMPTGNSDFRPPLDRLDDDDPL
jgi:hypothetical protein